MKLIERIEELSKLPRPSYSEADTKGKSLVIRWMLEDGLTVNKDIYGNIKSSSRFWCSYCYWFLQIL